MQPAPAAENAPALSEVQRIVNVFVAPSKTFEDIRRNASWWMPWLIGAVLSMGFVMVMVKKVDFEDMIRQQIMSSKSAQQFESLPKDQQEQRIAIAAKFGKVFTYFSPLIALVFSLLIALILMAIFNFIHASEISFGRSLAILFYGNLPLTLISILGIVTLLFRTDMEGFNMRNPVATNVAYFLDYATTPKFLYGMASILDVLVIWAIVLLGMGFRINSANRKLTTGVAIATVATPYLLYKLLFAALGWV
jgi:hypothetical protein